MPCRVRRRSVVMREKRPPDYPRTYRYTHNPSTTPLKYVRCVERVVRALPFALAGGEVVGLTNLTPNTTPLHP